VLAAVVVVVVSYVIGTFPTGVLVAGRNGRDVLDEGSGNPGASNVWRVVGFKAAAIVLFGDALKGVLATLMGLAVDGRVLALVCGLAAVVGHCFPIQRLRRGGKGVAAAAGMAVVLFPVMVLGLTAVWFLIARVLNKASLGSLIVALAAPVIVALTGRPGAEIALVVAVCALVIARHHGNIRRLIRGEESSLRSPA
jgi:acyl phosphate:glycerol-3-phosphate acyltransferase